LAKMNLDKSPLKIWCCYFWRNTEVSGFSRREFFCPREDCHQAKRIQTVKQLATHMRVSHGASPEETADMMRYFIETLLPERVKMVVRTDRSERVRRNRSFCRCPHPGCKFISTDPCQVEAHVKSNHKSLKRDIESLGWFWGTIRGMVKKNPRVTIAEALGEGHFWECKMENCHRPFSTQSAVRIHFSHAHTACTQEGWETSMRRLKQDWSLDRNEEEGRLGTDVETGAETRGRRRGRGGK
jgi:hypothetical protein